MSWDDEIELQDAVGTPDTFKRTYRSAAERAGKELGVDPNVILGQWGLETDWGKKVIPGTNNLGNIKSPTGVSARDNQLGTSSRYAKYDSADDFADAYVRLIKARYPGAVGAGEDSKAFASALKGYAQDTRYAGKVQSASTAVSNANWADDITLDPIANDTPQQTAPASQPKKSEPTRAEEDLRGVGLGARNVVQGATSPLTFLGDTLNRGINAGIRGVNSLAGTNIPQLGMPSQAVNNALTTVGLPQPATSTERVLGDVQSGVAGALSGAGLSGGLSNVAANPIVRNALAQLADRPRMQALSAATGAGASGVAREEGASPTGQMIAGLAGSLSPAAGIAMGAAATRNALRGSAENIPGMLENMKTFGEAGSTRPSVGQVTGNRVSQSIESVLSKTPGGAGQMAKRAEQQAEEIGARATQIADALSPDATPSVAGRTIEKGLTGPGGFVDRFKQGQKALYGKLDQYIKPDAPIKMSNTERTLASMNQDIKGAKNLSARFKNSEVMQIEEALRADARGQGGALPYEAVKKLRSQVGEKIENASMSDSVPRSQWRALYASLSQDLDQAARATGNADAVKAMERANRFSRAGYARIEDVLDKVAKQDIPEKVFKSAVNPSDMQAGATKIGSIMKSLTPAERDVVKSAFIRRMGLASAGQQGAEGDRFSTQTFLTNWNKMSPQAKSVMFSGPDGKLRVSLEQIAKAADSIKSGSKVFANPSGTSHATAQIGLAGGIAGAIASGNVGVAAGLLGGAAGANLTARLMTYQPFVQWLAKTTRVSPGAIPAAISALQRSMQSAPDDVKRDADQYAQALK